MRELFRGLTELLFPLRCPLCGGAPNALDAAACQTCWDRLEQLPLDPNPCRIVGLDTLTAAVSFTGDAEKWIRRFKYPRPGLSGLDPAPLTLMRALARQAARRAPGPAPDLVVPIPLHPVRLRERGFNPAALVAREVARALARPLAARALARLRDTPSQTGLDRRARIRNVAGAFRARRPIPCTIWLVDDVVTTGSTLREAARALRLAGARSVHGVCIARTPHPR